LRHPSGADAPDEAAALFALADRALVTGAPLLASIDGYATNLRRIERSAAIERARRLPVKLLFPLALLILPGFLLLTLGPALLAGLGRVGL
jgi:tight adherence protein C